MRFAKKPGLSLTTMTVFPSDRPKATAVVTTSGAVCAVTMISSSGILCTGEKKCMPSTRSGRFDALAIAVMGIVLVFVAKMASGNSAASASASTACFTARSSNTASMTSCTRRKPVYSTVPETSDSSSSNCCRVICRLASRSASTFRTAPRPRATCSSFVSLRRTGTPRIAATAAIPAPMKPAPTTPSRSIARAAGAVPATPISRFSEVVA